MQKRAGLDQQMQLDTAVKLTLVRMDDIRQHTYDLQPMNGRIHNRPPEQSIQMIDQWREMEEQNAIISGQELDSDSDSYSSEDEYETSDEEDEDKSETKE